MTTNFDDLVRRQAAILAEIEHMERVELEFVARSPVLGSSGNDDRARKLLRGLIRSRGPGKMVGGRIGRRAGNLEEGTMIYVRIIDDDDLTGAKAWSTFTAFLNADELIDEIALAARESSHAEAAYEILREASGGAIPTRAARLFTIDARNSRA